MHLSSKFDSRFLPLAALSTAAAILYAFPTSHLYPACPFHGATGLLCPGCGATRALAALLNGHLGEAFHQNALFTLLFPAILAYAIVATCCRAWPTIPTPILYGLLALTLAFTLARNLP